MSLLRVPPGQRLAVIGDVGGHVDALRAELARLGVPGEGDGPLPPDLLVVQVGDLIHRGPDSAGVVALVDRHLRADPDRWIQLVGNHEAFYLRRKQFSWPERVPRGTVAVLRNWWTSGRMRPAVAIRAAGEDLLVSHAGLTRGFWADVLGAPSDVAAAADAINALAHRNGRALFKPGTMVGWRDPDHAAGPVWAAAGTEVAASWSGHPLPFSQVHGHSSAYNWEAGSWNLGDDLRQAARLDDTARHVVITLPGGRLVGVDPGHGAEVRRQWRAFELPGGPVTPSGSAPN
ncbi:metallophosphoesterase [Micropruina sp.]|uniref:metallophosphoesterase n=1 Tax=Micropruina sp. TaxID=2737536 RepID=UPI00260368C6|nr:metallophosphoesterase [Micropruina sp.]